MKLRSWISSSLVSMAAAIGIAIVSGILATVLHALGDSATARAVGGVTVVSTTMAFLSLVALVACLAIAELTRDSGPDKHE